MRRALSEYYISGIVNNIALLNLVMENENFVKGNYDINFIEEHLLNKNSIESIDSESNNEDFENAAVILASVLKSKASVNGSLKKNQNNNRWMDQLYE